MIRSRTRSARIGAVRDSFWLIPAACAVGAVLGAIGLSVLEVRLVVELGGVLPSGPAGARSLLSSIITAMISFTALVFSITVVALQLASSQYSPRVLRTFLQDRVIQLTLGTFVATFLFAMVVLAALPDGADVRLPEVSLALAIALVLLSSGIFIYYLHHITTVMRVSHIIAAIGAQTRRNIERHDPRSAVPGGDDPRSADSEVDTPLGQVVQVVGAPAAGMVTDVALEPLARLAREHDCAISVLPTPGDFVVAGAPILAVHQVGENPPRPLDETAVTRTVSLGVERTPGQDVGFGFRQLADIAERALSPGVNDVTTAVRALQEAHDLLRRVAGRPVTARIVRDEDGTVRARVERPSFDSFLAVTIDDVRLVAGDQPRVTRLLDAILADLATVALPEHRPALRRRQADERSAGERS